MSKKYFSSPNFLRFSLIFVLVGSLRHVAWGFSTLESAGGWGLFWGYFQAIAIDLVVIALAYGIEQRKRSGLPTLWYWVGIVGFVFVSTYANLLYGLVFSSQVQASKDWPTLSLWMVYLKPFVLSGVLPIMLVYISHITAGSQVGGVIGSRPGLKTAWVKSIIDGYLKDTGRKPTPAELAKVYAQETGQTMTGQEANGYLIIRPVVLYEGEQVNGQGVHLDQHLDDEAQKIDADPETIKQWRSEGLTWPQIEKKTGLSKTTLYERYKTVANGNGNHR